MKKWFSAIIKLPYNSVFLFWQARRSENYNRLEKKQLFRALLRLYIKQSFNSKTQVGGVSVNIMGYRVHGYSYKSLALLFSEIFVGNDYFFRSQASNPVIIDCGGNIGMSVLYFKTRYPTSRIICFEPNPVAFAFLKKNVEANNLQNVEIINKAISDSNGKTVFYAEDYSAGVTSSLLDYRGGQKRVEAETVTLSAIIEKYKPDCVKLDIEGAEAIVLKDIVNTGAIQKVEQWLVEYHHKIADERSKLSEFLAPFEQEKFDYNIRTSYKRKGKFQDLLIHFYVYDLYNQYYPKNTG